MSETTTSAGRRWYIRRRGREVGPYTSAQVFGLIKKKQLRPDDELRQGDHGPWLSAEQVARKAVEAKQRKAAADVPDLPAARPIAAVPPPPAAAGQVEPVYVLGDDDEADDDPAVALAAAAEGRGYDDGPADDGVGAYEVDAEVDAQDDEDAGFEVDQLVPAEALAAPKAPRGRKAARPAPRSRPDGDRPQKAGRPGRGMYIAAGVLVTLAVVLSVGAGVYMVGGGLGLGGGVELPDGAVSKDTMIVVWMDIGSMDADDIEALSDMPKAGSPMSGGMLGGGSGDFSRQQLDALQDAGIEAMVVTMEGRSLFGGTPRIFIKAAGGSEDKLRAAIAKDGEKRKVRELTGGWWVAAEDDDGLKLPDKPDAAAQRELLADLSDVPGEVRFVMNMGGFGSSAGGHAPESMATGVDLGAEKMVMRLRFADADAAEKAYESFDEGRDKQLKKASGKEAEAIRAVRASRSGDTMTIRADFEAAKSLR